MVMINDLQVRYWHRHYTATRNPVYVWRAIAICTATRLPFPAWILTYLAETAARVGRAPKCTAATFGFPAQRGWNIARALQKDLKDEMVAMLYCSSRRPGQSKAEALEQASGREDRNARRQLKAGQRLFR